jgi:hypothetical protein
VCPVDGASEPGIVNPGMDDPHTPTGREMRLPSEPVRE